MSGGSRGQHADLRTTLEVLAGVSTMHDVSGSVWEPDRHRQTARCSASESRRQASRVAGRPGSASRSEPRVPKLEPIAPRVWVLRGGLLRTMNAYLIEDVDGVVVFDTGEKGMAPAIGAAAARLGGISTVVLGHGDTDHRGSAPQLSKVAPVVCHPDAVAEAEGSGGRSYWDMGKLPLAIRHVHRFLHRFVWDGGPVRISGTVSEGDEIAGFEVIDLAGHAPGQIGLWRAADRVALVSDTVYMTTMAGRPTAAHVPHEAYNLDTERARAAIRKLARLHPRVVAVGHLGPMRGAGAVAELERAADA